mmetsp:Transcript_87945/g.250815  ORF Transcript_87945/g.250815 Transcript_87945/m.250815 type:complete len:678 (-) Transcript_87945:534-2567(-)
MPPGYGFLSENEHFAAACAANDVTFIGPPVPAIQAMGSKSTSKAIMIDANVPVTPGYHGNNQDPEALKAEAERIKYPVLIKATLGGGGKGMRLVERPEDFLDALDACKREALKGFGDDTVLLERFVQRPRHVEFQIFGDHHGNAVHLAERDCSVQRRHQKVLEEAPAPGLPHDVRQSMGEAAVAAAKAVGYVGAGTVEFLVDTTTNEFFFCEMNTRLQVEHPVTEMITGLDLVEWQLQVAAGGKLPIVEQAEIDDRLSGGMKRLPTLDTACKPSRTSSRGCIATQTCKLGAWRAGILRTPHRPRSGHAIEARVYAENPGTGFLPATGNLRKLREPPADAFGDSTVRVDTGVAEGDNVTMFYDPMISKLIVHSKDRATALRDLNLALRSYQVAGVPTNLSFLERCASHPAFMEGGISTSFLDDHGEALVKEADLSPTPPSAVAVAAAAMVLNRNEASRRGLNLPGGAWGQIGASWRAFDSAQGVAETFAIETDGGGSTVDVEVRHHSDGTFTITVPSEDEATTQHVEATFKTTAEGTTMEVVLDKMHRFDVDVSIEETQTETSVHLFAHNATDTGLGPRHVYNVVAPKATFQGASDVSSAPLIKAVMPGKIVRVLVEVGDVVEADQPLVILEAMKMEHVIKANGPGCVSAVSFAEGEIVADGAILVELEVADEVELAA